MFRTALILFFALSAATVSASICGDVSAKNSYQVGLSLQVLLPGDLPDFANNPSAYGAIASWPVGLGDSIQLQLQYGSAEKFSVYLIESNYRLLLPTPFLTMFVLGGGHFMHYALDTNGHDGFGGNLGFGILLPVARDFQIALALKTYLESRPIVSFGGGFSFLL